MYLPLAGREPSPCVRSHAQLRIVRRLSNTLSLLCRKFGTPSCPAGPRFEFARRGHRQKIHSNCLISLRALYCQEKNGEIRLFSPRFFAHGNTSLKKFEKFELTHRALIINERESHHCRGSLPLPKYHVADFLSTPHAFFRMQSQIIR